MKLITTWWAADRPHWQRTGVVVGILVLVVTVVVAGINVNVDRETSKGPQPSSNTAADEDQPSNKQTLDIKGGWGPARKVVSVSSGGTPYPAYNCVIDNPNYGDERQFMVARKANSAADYSSKVEVREAGQYQFRILINNCGPDGDIESMSSWIQDAAVELHAPEGASEVHQVVAYLRGANVTEVWAFVALWSDQPFKITDSAREAVLYSNAHPTQGLKIGSNIFHESGFKLGYEEMDGNIRPGYQYANYIYITLEIEFE